MCQFPGCTKGYQRGGFCRNHGGGSRCTVPFCIKVDAGHGLCRSHGGGKRCKAADCGKADVAPPVAFAYRRLLVQVQLQAPWTELRVLALLQSEPQVRSVHILGYRHSSAPRQPKSAVCFVVRWAAHSSAALELALGALDVRYSVLENSLVEDMASLVVVETILKVNGMMCVANCGNTVVRAIQSVASVLEVHLEFDDAKVVVQSHNTVTAHALIARIQAIGFEADLVSVTPVPWHRQFHMQRTGGCHVTMDVALQLETVLSHVEGVEKVAVVPHLATVDVFGFFDVHEVVLMAATVALHLTDREASVDPLQAEGGSTPVHHECSFACSSGCIKYQTTMAHTAALAVGWAVPGCGMAFVVWLDPTTNEAKGVLLVTPAEVAETATVDSLKKLLANKLLLENDVSQSTLRLHGQHLTSEDLDTACDAFQEWVTCPMRWRPLNFLKHDVQCLITVDSCKKFLAM
ncbi:hypothetical protein DYB28_006475 [Aphanomyces astaci]|nr:hypothetical protein DYB28_006475 [Aphanomyces astaci]